MNLGDTKLQAIPKKLSRGSEMTWIDDMTIQCEGVRLQLTKGFKLKDSSAEVVSIFKDPMFVRDYVHCLEGVDARNVLEVGIKHGGSAIFFWNLLIPEKLCCIELNSSAAQLTAYVERQGYPALLITTGLWDSQVQYFEPAKWVARLRRLKTDHHPLLFRVDLEAGHGGKSGRFQAYRELAEEYAFILDQAGIRE